MNLYAVSVKDQKHESIQDYVFCDLTEAFDFYHAEKQAISRIAGSRYLTVSKPEKREG